MKVISIENPLLKEEIEKLDGYFNEKVHCNCGAIFETNVLDVTLIKDSINIHEHSNLYKATVECPLCGTTYRLGYYNLFKKDLEAVEIYKKYLRSKNKFDEMNLE